MSTADEKRDELTVEIESEAIIIRLPLSTLEVAVKACPKLEEFDEKTGDFLTPKVTSAATFAQEVVRALDDEEEDGTTLVHRMFDRAFLNAIESGAEGILMPGDDGYSNAE